MTELAYMVREDWAQRGTAMRRQSAVIREWLGNPPWNQVDHAVRPNS